MTNDSLNSLVKLANATLDCKQSAQSWLCRAHPMLDNKTPLETAKTPMGMQRVKSILVAIKHGGAV